MIFLNETSTGNTEGFAPKHTAGLSCRFPQTNIGKRQTSQYDSEIVASWVNAIKIHKAQSCFWRFIEWGMVLLIIDRFKTFIHCILPVESVSKVLMFTGAPLYVSITAIWAVSEGANTWDLKASRLECREDSQEDRLEHVFEGSFPTTAWCRKRHINW